MTESHPIVMAVERMKWAIDTLNAAFGKDYPYPAIDTNLTGRTAGKAYYREYKVSINVVLLMENVSDYIENTIPHEVAHLIAVKLWGRIAAGHGYHWKVVMMRMGLVPERCHSYDVRNAISEAYDYVCEGCGKKFVLSGIKHRRMQAQGGRYICNHCKMPIKFVG